MPKVALKCHERDCTSPCLTPNQLPRLCRPRRNNPGKLFTLANGWQIYTLVVVSARQKTGETVSPQPEFIRTALDPYRIRFFRVECFQNLHDGCYRILRNGGRCDALICVCRPLSALIGKTNFKPKPRT